MVDRRTPVIVGVGQVEGASGAAEPIDLVALAVERAIQDSGTRALPVDLIALSKIGTRQYRNAPRLLGARTGFPNARTLQADHGGHTSQLILCHAATSISQGRSEAVIVAGGELGTSIKKGLFVSDTGTPTGGAGDEHPDEALGDDLYQWISHPHEEKLGIAEPIHLYPVMETALGAALGRTRDEHLLAISQLWARFSEVAAGNEFANDRRRYSAEEIVTASPSNRFVGYPYTKLMNSNQFVDQAAAILMCSSGVAMDLGISRDNWVFPWAGVSAHAPFVSERRSLHDSPALAVASQHLEQLIGRPLRDVEIVDLYACFPFAVQAQANALGLDPSRELTQTGGMRFAGGPWNNYGAHMIANIVKRVRAEPKSLALCSTNGGFATRFCVATYGGQPSPHGFRTLPAPLTDPTPRRRLETQPSGRGQIEGYSVRHAPGNRPVDAIASCILADASRAWARLSDAEDVVAMLTSDPIGRSIVFDGPTPRLE
jgi:acetyl-CoA C-acetyltransferase